MEYDGSNRLWTWASRFAEDVWGHAPTQEGAQQAFETWLRGSLERLRPVLDAPDEKADEIGCRAISFTYAATARMCLTSPGQTSAILIKRGRLPERLPVI